MKYLNIGDTHVKDGSPGLRFSNAASSTTSTAAMALFTTILFFREKYTCMFELKTTKIQR